MKMKNKILYKEKDYDSLMGINGLSEDLLKNHLALYKLYVANSNKMIEELNRLRNEDKTETQEFSEIKRRISWELNGMRLHEYFFENLTKEESALSKDSLFMDKLNEDFGSYEEWEKDFKGVAKMRGIGWVILYYDPIENRLFNAWIEEHHQGHISGWKPLLLLDVYEHAYMLDYGTKKGGYIDAFFSIINWDTVIKRFTEEKK